LLPGGSLRIRSLRQQPAPDALTLDRSRERFVEHGIVAHVHHLVRQLMEDQASQLRLGLVDERVEQRIGEPTQG
jgi:hypothetical protein